MPTISHADYHSLIAIARQAREAFLNAKLRPEADVERYAARIFVESELRARGNSAVLVFCSARSA